jgi:HEAT repeat protein
MGGPQTSQALLDIYSADKDPMVRKNVINALFTQGNATALVALARKETDLDMKKSIVQKLSVMGGKVATDYMLEILNK